MAHIDTPETQKANRRFIQQAIEVEARRQIAIVEGGGKVEQETRLYDPDKGEDGEFCFPPGEAERVADGIGTTPENFRQLRSRALRRVRATLEREGLAPVAKGDAR